MGKKTKKGSPHKDPAKKPGSKFFISSLARLLGKDAGSIARAEKIRKLLKKVKGIPSDADVAQIKKIATKETRYKGGLMVKPKAAKRGY